MKGDFSRDTFNEKKHYSAVLMQQGRVQDDADWNEGQSISQYRDEVEAHDVIGRSGAPKHDAGFKITTDGTTMTIGKGRYYVDGLLCENETDLTYDEQNAGDLPGASVAAVLESLKRQQTQFGIVYLDVWKRQITSLEDPLIREVALGGADTATRVRVVWQVRVLPVTVAGAAELQGLLTTRRDLEAKAEEAAAVDARLEKQLTVTRAKLDALPPTSPDRLQLEQLITRITAQRAEVATTLAGVRTDLEKVHAEIERLTGGTNVGCRTKFDEWEQVPTISTGTLKARTGVPGAGEDPCLLPPTAGYRRLSNQLYRVEVHDGGALGAATFKWSRDNGSVVTTMEKISGNAIFVHDLGRDEELGFRAGDWVELIDDALELNDLPGQLARINPPNEATREITLIGATPTPLAATPDGVDPRRHPKLRRWDQVDQQGAPAGDRGIKTSGTWISLEDGIEVQFGDGSYRTGDYWLIPARTATGDLEWPPFASPNTAPSAQPPRGIRHHLATLAVLRVNDGRLDIVDDCRPVFCPLTEVACSGGTGALHVVATSWRNDEVIALEPGEGLELRLTLDAAPDARSVSDASVIVMVEQALTVGQQPSTFLFQRLILDGQVGVDRANPRVIVWHFKPSPTPALPELVTERSPPSGRSRKRGAAARTAGDKTSFESDESSALTLPRAGSPRMYVLLKGHLIWRDDERGRGPKRYLDGQAFGVPGVRADGTVNTTLTLPSGAGTRASDFESWFYLGRGPRPVAPLRILSVTFVRADGQPSSAGTAMMPAPAGAAIRFKATEKVRFIDIAFTRRIVPLEQRDPAKPQSVLVLRPVAAGPARVLGRVTTPSETVLRFEAEDPEILVAGRYTLSVLGDAGDAPAVAGDPNGPRLDGDFDNKEGGNFTLPFVSV